MFYSAANTTFCCFKKRNQGTRKIIQWLRVNTAPAEDLSSAPSSHAEGLLMSVNYISKGSDGYPLLASADATLMFTYLLPHKGITKNNKNSSSNNGFLVLGR